MILEKLIVYISNFNRKIVFKRLCFGERWVIITKINSKKGAAAKGRSRTEKDDESTSMHYFAADARTAQAAA